MNSILTSSPFALQIASFSDALDVTMLPSTDSIISPAQRPASFAGQIEPSFVSAELSRITITPSILSRIPKGSPPGMSIGVSISCISAVLTGITPKSFNDAVQEPDGF